MPKNTSKRKKTGEAVVQRCSVKKVFLEISQNSQENTCARDFIKKSLWHRCFPVNFVKSLRTPFFHKTPLVAPSETGTKFCSDNKFHRARLHETRRELRPVLNLRPL